MTPDCTRTFIVLAAVIVLPPIAHSAPPELRTPAPLLDSHISSDPVSELY